jgi:hypothetical protein
MRRLALLAAVGTLLGVPAAVASATPTGTYQARSHAVSCAWSPRDDYVACATPAMARRGESLSINSLDGAARDGGEVIRGGKSMRPGAELDGAGSVSCTFGRTSVRCSNGESGFKLGRGVKRLW